MLERSISSVYRVAIVQCSLHCCFARGLLLAGTWGTCRGRLGDLRSSRCTSSGAQSRAHDPVGRSSIGPISICLLKMSGTLYLSAVLETRSFPMAHDSKGNKTRTYLDKSGFCRSKAEVRLVIPSFSQPADPRVGLCRSPRKRSRRRNVNTPKAQRALKPCNHPASYAQRCCYEISVHGLLSSSLLPPSARRGGVRLHAARMLSRSKQHTFSFGMRV